MNDVNKTLNERGRTYGDFTEHASICQKIKHLLMAQPGWTRLNHVQMQALEVIADKIARILSGDPNYADNWHDIQGYAKLVEDRLPKPEQVRAAGPTVGQMESIGPKPDPMADLIDKITGSKPRVNLLTEDDLKDLPPEIADLIGMLQQAGAKIAGVSIKKM